MTIDDFINQTQGESLSYDNVPANAGQCVQLVEFFITEVYGLQPFWGDAIDWWNNYGGSLTYFDKVTDGYPKRGDLVVWGTGVGSKYGHIDVCVEDGSPSGFKGYDSNWGNNKTAHFVQHNYNSVLGYLRPKGAQLMTPSRDEIKSQFVHFIGIEPEEYQLKAYNVPGGWGALNGDLLQYNFDRNPPMNTGDLKNLFGEIGVTSQVNDNDINYHMNEFKGGWKHAFYDLIKRPDRVKPGGTVTKAAALKYVQDNLK